MKKLLRRFHALALSALLTSFLPSGTQAAGSPPESSELAQARARLLDLYSRKFDDGTDQVKNTKLEIARLEYLAAHAPAKAEDPVPLINIDFAGGSVAQLVTAIAKTNSGVFNVLGEESELQTRLPPFSVRQVSPSALGQAIAQLMTPHGLMLWTVDRTTFVLRRDPNFAFQQNQIDQRASQFASIPLSAYLEEHSIDDIVGAIRTAWELSPLHNPADLQIKFHPPTKLLLASGSVDAINIVHQVIATLAQNQKAPSKSDAPPAAPAEKK
jgi:hypothetical protein